MDGRVRELVEVAVSAGRGCAMCGSPFLEPGTDACDEWGLCLACYRRTVSAAEAQAAREKAGRLSRKRAYDAARKTLHRHGVLARQYNAYLAAIGIGDPYAPCPECGAKALDAPAVEALAELAESMGSERAVGAVLARLAANGVTGADVAGWMEGNSAGRGTPWESSLQDKTPSPTPS